MRTGWIEIAAIPAILLVAYLIKANHWISTHARRAWDWTKAWTRQAPFTTGLWLLVALHAWMLVGLPPRLRNAVLAVHSTNLAQLKRDPVTVLFASAIWTDVGELVFLTGMSLLILGPLERWIGTRRALATFLAGHVGATLIVAVWLEQAVTAHTPNGKSLEHTIDVGVSYGTYACAALLGYRLRLPYRLVAWGCFGGWLLYQAIEANFDVTINFTALGHLIAFGIGLLLYPLTLSKKAKARRTAPWIRIRTAAPAGFRTPAYLPAPASALAVEDGARSEAPGESAEEPGLGAEALPSGFEQLRSAAEPG